MDVPSSSLPNIGWVTLEQLDVLNRFHFKPHRVFTRIDGMFIRRISSLTLVWHVISLFLICPQSFHKTYQDSCPSQPAFIPHPRLQCPIVSSTSPWRPKYIVKPNFNLGNATLPSLPEPHRSQSVNPQITGSIPIPLENVVQDALHRDIGLGMPKEVQLQILKCHHSKSLILPGHRSTKK